MSNSYKPKNNKYIDSTSIVHNRKSLSRILEKSTITASISDNYKIQANATYEQLILDTSNVKGTGFSVITENNNVNKGGIKIGAGIEKVLISAKVVFNTVSAGTKWLSIYKNNSVIVAFPAVISDRNALVIPDIQIDVAQNDVVVARVQGNANDVIRGTSAYSHITVKEV